jgi:hypothetical protein
MSLNDFLDIEKAIASLKTEDKQKIASSISLLLLNAVTNQNTIDSFGLLQRIMSLLIIDNQKKFLTQINNILISTIVSQESRDLFPAFQRLSQSLDENKKQKLFSDISLILQSSLQNMLEAHINSPVNTSSSTSNPLASLAKGLPINNDSSTPQPIAPQNPMTSTSSGMMRPPQPMAPPNPMTSTSAGMMRPPQPMAPPNPMTSTSAGMMRPPQPMAPPNPMNTSNSGTMRPPQPMAPPNPMNTSNSGMMRPPQPMAPPNPMNASNSGTMRPPQPIAPPNPMNTSNSGTMRPPQSTPPSNPMDTSNSGIVVNKTTANSNQQQPSGAGLADIIRKNLNSSSNPGMLNMTTTGGGIRTGTLTGSVNLKGKDENRISVPLEESLANISAILIDSGKKALKDFNTPIELYELLKNLETNKSLFSIYTTNYPNQNLAQFLNKIYSAHNSKYFFLRKTIEFSPDQDLKLRIGEWLVILGYIDREKLARVVQLHQVAVRNFESLNKRYATKSGANYAGAESKGPMFGNFLVDSDVINRNQLNEALICQTQFNELLESLK